MAGHARLEAAAYLGLREVPVITLDDLTPAQAKAYMLADNKLTDRSEFKFELVAIHLKELSDNRLLALNVPMVGASYVRVGSGASLAQFRRTLQSDLFQSFGRSVFHNTKLGRTYLCASYKWNFS